MELKTDLSPYDIGAMHDVILDATGNKPSRDEIKEWWEKLPRHIKGIAISWGCSDTVFRDEMYAWIEEQIKG